MKKAFLFLSILCIISNSFAGQLTVCASGYYAPDSPHETGTYDSVYMGSYYGNLSVSINSSNIYGPTAFTLTDLLYTSGGINYNDKFYYGDYPPFNPIPTSAVYAYIGSVDPYTTIGINLEVFGVDTFAIVNY